jgi:putative sterol carrier protein
MSDDSTLTARDIAGMSPEEFARLVKQTPGKQLAELTSGELREPILAEVFSRMAGRLRPDKAARLRALIRWRIGGRPDGGHDEYETAIDGGACTVGPRSDAEPRLTVTTDAVSFLRLASGNASGPVLFMTGKLKLAGDLGLGAGLTSIFDIPKA